jgi:hypothetical protein
MEDLAFGVSYIPWLLGEDLNYEYLYFRSVH